jgi:hypothetical protein
MRIRRENKGKDIIVNAAVEIEKPLDTINNEAMINNLMESYGIPLMIEMGTRLFKAIQHDFKKTDKTKRYALTLVCQDVTDGN